MNTREMYQVVIDHQTSYPYSLEIRVGEKVTISRRKEKGWVWCTDKEGVGAWIPEKYLKRKEDVGTMKVDYNSTELTASIGERLRPIKEESGWVWCTNQNGQNGWIPLYKVKKL